jgi:hypothetical protein
MHAQVGKFLIWRESYPKAGMQGFADNRFPSPGYNGGRETMKGSESGGVQGE